MREANGGKAIAIQADATDADASKAAVEKTVATFGPGQLRCHRINQHHPCFSSPVA